MQYHKYSILTKFSALFVSIIFQLCALILEELCLQIE